MIVSLWRIYFEGFLKYLKLKFPTFRLDNPEIIDGVLTFTEPLNVTGNFDVDTTVNGIDISEEVMTTNTDQVSNGLYILMFILSILKS